MSQRASGFERVLNDNETPIGWPVQLLVPHLRPLCRHCWDPADGPNSTLARVLCAEGFQSTVTTTDFLARRSLPESSIDAVVTNPPYGSGGRLAQRFIEHALELVPVVAMLLRVDFDSGVSRRHLFGDCETFALKLVLLDRIVWFEHRGKQTRPSDNHAWFLWARHHHGPPILRYAHPRDLEESRYGKI
jgi:hypothetical protein